MGKEDEAETGGEGGAYEVGYGKPPKRTQFSKGISGCANGRGGNKPPAAALRRGGSITVDFRAELAREITLADGDTIRISAFLLRAGIKEAANGNSSVLKYYLDLCLKLDADAAAEAIEAIRWYRRASSGLIDENYGRHCAGKPSIDVTPHPEHVVLDGTQLRIRGPIDRSGRSAWEFLKYQLHACVTTIRALKAALAERSSAELEAALAQVEKRRRHLMRQVPKGWNWRERIHTLGASQEELLGYAHRNQNAAF